MDANVIMLEKVAIYPFKVISNDGDVYKLLAERFEYEVEGFAFYIGKKKVSWFKFGIVKVISIADEGVLYEI